VSRYRYTESIKAFLFMSGWIKVHRKVQDHWIFKEQREFSRFEAWLDILLCANHSEQKVIIQGTVYTVKQGESLHSLETWAKRWNWSKTKVRRFFDTLTKELMIETTNETKTTRLTICNYASYQVERNADETTKKRRRNADETQTAPNKNEENDNNDKQTYYRVINHLKITEEEFTSLSADFSKQQIDDVLDQIENYKDNKKYVSLYLTAKNWLKKESKKQDTKVSSDPLVIEMERQFKMYGLK
jgi:hypothetical protein